MFSLSHRWILSSLLIPILVLTAWGQSPPSGEGKDSPKKDKPGESSSTAAPAKTAVPDYTDLKQDVHALLEKVDKGDPEAQYIWGMRTLKGLGTPKNIIGGAQWLSMASDKDYSEATYELFIVYGSKLGLPADKKEAKDLLDKKLSKIPSVMKSKSLLTIQKAQTIQNYLVAYMYVAPTTDRKLVFDKLIDLFAKEYPGSTYLHYATGRFYVDYAWDARTGKFANEVTREQFEEFERRLKLAKEALEKAYELDHQNYAASSAMVQLAMGLGLPRPEMEKWFERCIAANPTYLPVYSAKMTYLEPKWHGSPEEMIEFGKECLKKGQWQTSIPLMLINAHERIAMYYNQQNPVKPGDEHQYPYYIQPGVWEDISMCYEGQLKAFPDSPAIRSKMLRYAGMCEKWDFVKKELKSLGNYLDQSVFRSPTELEYIKKMAEK